jgi:hypothetical protein
LLGCEDRLECKGEAGVGERCGEGCGWEGWRWRRCFYLSSVSEGKEGEKGHTIEFCERLDTSHLVTFYNLAWVETHYEEMFCFFEQLARKD